MTKRAPKTPQPSSAYTNVTDINDELSIGLRSAQRKATWYLLKMGTSWPRRSLGTQDLREAKALALKGYQAWLADPN